MAAIIIPTPPVISKYFSVSIVVLLGASALVPHFHCYRMPPKEHPNDLSKNKFFRQQRHRHGKDQSRHHRDECNRYLHNAPLSVRPNSTRNFCALRGSSPRSPRSCSELRRAESPACLFA